MHLSQDYTNQDIQDAYAELVELHDSDVLYSADDYEQYANMMVASPIKAMCLHIAHDCNLRCKYCFCFYRRFWRRTKAVDSGNRTRGH